MGLTIPDGVQLTAFDDDFYRDPYAIYEKLRRLDPIHKDAQSFFGESWTISQYSLVHSLLRDDRLSVDPRSIGLRRDPRADNAVTLREPDMMNLDGDDHQRLRKLVQKAFTPKLVHQSSDRIERVIDERMALVTESVFDVVSQLSKPIPTIVIADFIGVDSSDHEQFKAWTDTLLMQGYPMPSAEQWQAIVAADGELRTYMVEVIERRRQTPAEDLVSRLTVAQSEEGQLNDREIIDMVCLLIGAGNFTTTDLISNVIYHSLLQEQGSATPEAIVAECLRFDSPVLAVRRFVKEDIALRDVVLQKGSVVNLLLGAANHDPDVFPAGDEFQISASDRSITFGRGVHHCLGAALAKMEATLTLTKFRERFPNAKLIDSERSRRMDFRGFRSLSVSA
ncbi:MAG: cytochrome P450 [Pseudomonadales bacterium]|nr:cytochrome P450 [Pseudomonadales bacterium]